MNLNIKWNFLTTFHPIQLYHFPCNQSWFSKGNTRLIFYFIGSRGSLDLGGQSTQKSVSSLLDSSMLVNFLTSEMVRGKITFIISGLSGDIEDTVEGLVAFSTRDLTKWRGWWEKQCYSPLHFWPMNDHSFEWSIFWSSNALCDVYWGKWYIFMWFCVCRFS